MDALSQMLILGNEPDTADEANAVDRSYWTLLEHPPKSLEMAIVQAEHSDRWHPDDVQRLKALSRRESKPDAGKVSLHVLPNSGHWVHVDNPKGLLEIMAPNFLSTVKN